jgi:fatty acid synthase
VSRATPMISPLIKWNHKENYHYLKYDERIENDKKYMILLQDPEYEFIAGHEIDRKYFHKNKVIN